MHGNSNIKYWSRYFVYQNIFVPAVNNQNRFQKTLFFHFADNALAGDDRLAKVYSLISMLAQTSKHSR